ncbi:MAG: DNA/RNA nuclease SfsA [Promethearchaeota archaeon]|nr:MAG: DNA/RNA nuclease SfsA [Candidatus Lokiarchaeota archaeon]
MNNKAKKIPIYELESLKKGTFLVRHNRFAGEIKYDNVIESAHIHDPGRLEELLNPGVDVLFTDSRGKLTYYIKAVKKEGEWILLDSALHSKIARCLFPLIPQLSIKKEIKSEVKLGESRIDFTLDGVPLEVKGVSLVKDDTALFPDAPTKRGTRHVKEIIKHDGIILFLVFRKAERFAPNFKMDPKFANALKKARKQGILIIPTQLSFDGKTVFFEEILPLGEF